MLLNHIEDVEKLPELDKACVVAQQPQHEVWDELVNKLKHKVKDLKEFNTICYATAQRQRKQNYRQDCDVMLVIGKKQLQYKKLYNICKSYRKTYDIEKQKILILVFLIQQDVGSTAGASTPD